MGHTILALLIVFSLYVYLIYNYLTTPVSGGGKSKQERYEYYLSPQVSNALKGFSAILIICHHWCLYNLHTISDPNILERILPWLGGTFALVVFLFLSGYGITRSEEKSPNSIEHYAKKRVWKIYKPAFIIYLITALVYSFGLSFPVDANAIKDNWLNGFIVDWSNHDISAGLLFQWFVTKLDWYVFTTIVLYVIFYVSYHSIRINSKNAAYKRVVLTICLIAIYYVIARYVFGASLAHYYRNLWAFLLGVILGLKPNLLKRYMFWIFCGLILTYNLVQEGIFYEFASLLALGTLLFFGITNKKYNVNSRLFVYLGGISYYLYLSHRMFYNVLWSYDKLYFPLFIILSVGFATIYTMIVRRTIHIA